MAKALVERFDGEVPGAMEDLVTVPGVGRKTANVVRSVALDLPGLPVDTHVLRLSRRLGLTTRDRSGEGRARAELDDPARGAGHVQPAVDPARPAGLHRPQPPLRGLRAERLLPILVDESVPLSSTDGSGVTRYRRGEGLRDGGNPVVSKSQPGSRHLVSGDAGIRRLASLRETAPSGAVVRIFGGCAQHAVTKRSRREGSQRDRQPARSLHERALGVVERGEHIVAHAAAVVARRST